MALPASEEIYFQYKDTKKQIKNKTIKIKNIMATKKKTTKKTAKKSVKKAVKKSLKGTGDRNTSSGNIKKWATNNANKILKKTDQKPVTQAQADAVIKGFFASMSDDLKNGSKCVVNQFGTFKTSKRSWKTKTSKKFGPSKSGTSTVVTFKPSQSLKDTVNHRKK